MQTKKSSALGLDTGPILVQLAHLLTASTSAEKIWAVNHQCCRWGCEFGSLQQKISGNLF